MSQKTGKRNWQPREVPEDESEEIEEAIQDLDFDILDQRYLSKQMVREEVLKALASLELEIHKLRLYVVSNDLDHSHVMENGVPVGTSLRESEEKILSVEHHSEAAINWVPDEQQ